MRQAIELLASTDGLEAEADPILLAAVGQLQVLHLLLLHGEVEEAADRLVGLAFGEDLRVQRLLERVLLLVGWRRGLARLRRLCRCLCRCRLFVLAAPPPRDDRDPGAGPARRGDAFVAVDLPMISAPRAGDLAAGVGLGLLAVLVGAEQEVVAVEEDVLAVLGLDFYFRHHIMSAEVVADQLLDISRIDMERNGEDQVLVFALGGGDVSSWQRRSSARTRQARGRNSGNAWREPLLHYTVGASRNPLLQ